MLPTVSQSVLRLVSPAVTVNVKVAIDNRGRVTKAESLTHGQSLVNTLSDAAVDAARHWVFVPARRGAQNVASETVLNCVMRCFVDSIGSAVPSFQPAGAFSSACT